MRWWGWGAARKGIVRRCVKAAVGAPRCQLRQRAKRERSGRPWPAVMVLYIIYTKDCTQRNQLMG